ncbi:MAG: TylF/MycF/NovP-related O-methyltransferase [Candidatus Saccharimonadales bacterium]
MDTVSHLLAKHPLVSNQVSKPQVETILRELEKVIAKDIRGDIVEFGCYVGTTSLFIRRLLNTHPAYAIGPTSHTTRSVQSHKQEFHVYDSFEGLPAKSAWDASPSGEQFIAGELRVSKKQFLHEFQKAHLRPPIVHKAWFSQLKASDVPEKIAFAFLDGDFYESIRDSLRLVLPRMQKGGVIVVDDYAREALPGVAKAVHEHFSADRIRIIHNLGLIHI